MPLFKLVFAQSFALSSPCQYRPDTEPSFSTSNITISGTEAKEYTVDIPAQEAANTFSSALMYLVTQDASVTITDFVITSYE